MSLIVARSKRFEDHEPGQWHPERPERIAAIEQALTTGIQEGLKLKNVTPREIEYEDLLRVHDSAYLSQLSTAEGQVAQLDPDTATSVDSVKVARLAAGTTLQVAEQVLAQRNTRGMSLVRPPGHHAIPSRAMGFCLLSNIAIVAKSLLDRKIVERVAIYDWDVHHGNGTQHIFYDDPRVLFMSTHQWPLYPGTGDKHETGADKGEGYTVNIPLPSGTDGTSLLEVTNNIFANKVKNFSPDLILISAGYDGHIMDPLGGFRCTTEDYRILASRWRELAETYSGGRLAAILEGGYHLKALGDSVRATLEAWE